MKAIRVFLLVASSFRVSPAAAQARADSPGAPALSIPASRAQELLAPGAEARLRAVRSRWDRLVEEFFGQVYFQFDPTQATLDGFHGFDSSLEDYSRASTDAETRQLARVERRVEAFDSAALGEPRAGDRELILSTIRGRLLTLRTLRPWEKDAGVYPGAVAGGVYAILSRRFAPPERRLASVVARERAGLGVLALARERLTSPARVFTELALEQLPGTIDFFERDVPAEFSGVADPRLKAEFAQANSALLASLREYERWLKADALPRSHADFRIGADALSKKLLFDEMVDVPLDRLLEIGRADLEKNRAQFRRIAKELEPAKTPEEVLAELTSRHPAPDRLLKSFRDTFDGLVAFIRAKRIVTLPSDVRPVVEDTPSFERATTIASMDTPGPFERVAHEAYFNVTVPAPPASAAEIEEAMGAFNVGTIVSTSIHEAYPGHYVQYLWQDRAPTKARKLLGALSNAEGWAHYCEQMMLDEGFGRPGVGAKDEREAKLIRLGQLQDALLRDARFVVAIEMHRRNMTFDQAVDFFVKEGYQPRSVARSETQRGAGDPTYLYYTLGKLEILKLREDVKKKQGPAFSLQRFHDDFLRQGPAPIKLVRKALLGDDSPVF